MYVYASKNKSIVRKKTREIEAEWSLIAPENQSWLSYVQSTPANVFGLYPTFSPSAKISHLTGNGHRKFQCLYIR